MDQATATTPSPPTRRSFLHTTVAASTAAVAVSARAATPGNQSTERVVVGVMGVERGLVLAKNFANVPGVEVRYLCDVDSQRLNKAHETFAKSVDYEVKTVADFRKMLDVPELDALVCAAPNHWHAPASILACSAGKHVYVEKPCCHNPREGELLIQAARKHKRCVQMGNQRRSGEKIIEAMGLLHGGRIGNVHYSRSWYAADRGPIGKGTPAEAPPYIDYELWQGPAPRLPFTSNRLHYNWHWVWNYGNGELGNNGIHSIDLSRWGLQVDYPERAVSSGGRYFYDDDQQTADTHVVSFEFGGGRQIVWECLSCNRYGADGTGFGATFHGDKGSLFLNSWGYKIFDEKMKEVTSVDGVDGLRAHIANFINAVRNEDPQLLHSDIEEGHKSTLLCHLGNIAHRTGDSLRCNPENGHVLDNEEAMKLWQREYEPGWEPKV
ncbi:MAG: Gfo/Idh/MocA family oxidoreductase [Planctomycetaceae bacterium]|nr:Gfo/Idh/MocA family oxidoreductase [Planctomycetaceae bacterium]